MREFELDPVFLRYNLENLINKAIIDGLITANIHKKIDFIIIDEAHYCDIKNTKRRYIHRFNSKLKKGGHLSLPNFYSYSSSINKSN